MVADEIVRTVQINASPQRVWWVLTEADLVSQWFGDRTSIDLRPGGAMELWWREHGEQRYQENTQGWDGELTELVVFAERAA